MAEFELDPNHLRTTAKDLDDVSTRMKDIKTRLTQQLAAEGAPWGSDDSGRKFYDGDNHNGYGSQVDWVNGSVDAKSGLLDEYSEGLRTGADNLEQMDGV